MEIINKYFSDFTPQQRNQFALLKNLYDDWNSKINVISRKDMDGLFEKHILHSLSIATVFSFEAGTEILDLGTGGGFPGIPLAIFFPNVKFHLVDSIAKKLNVVENIASSIGATNITVQHTRAEEIKGRKFEYVVSRAVAPLGDLWKWSKPLIRNKSVASDKKNGLICLKGGDLAQEIQDSGVRPQLIRISGIFSEPFFENKHIVFVPR